MLTWHRVGLLSIRDCPMVVSHAQAPTVVALRDDLWRVYFAGRDDVNRASVFALDIDPRDGMRLAHVYERPVLVRGERGAFDHFGLGPSSAFVRADGRIALYYTGITPRSDVPTEFAIGLATSDDGLHFERACAGPVFARGPFDPYFVSTPFVRAVDAGYEMWYSSGTGWTDSDERAEPVYDLRKAYSRDGIVWDAASAIAVRATDLGAVAIARPWIDWDGSSERVWFCLRGEDFRSGGSGAYRLWSAPLTGSTIDAKMARPVVFDNAAHDGQWDYEMQAYPCIVRRNRDLVMFYNGDDFGRAGFGWAVARAAD